MCGSISGAVAAAATTPLDLMKTRVMLGGADGSAWSILGAMARVRREEGSLALFHGLWPRVGWMTLGGYIFFGAYEHCLAVLSLMEQSTQRHTEGAAGVRRAGHSSRDGRSRDTSRDEPHAPPPPPLSAPTDSSAVAEGASEGASPAASAAVAAAAVAGAAGAAEGGSDAALAGPSGDVAETAVTLGLGLRLWLG